MAAKFCCVEKNIDGLKKAVDDGKLFSSDLKKCVFKTLLEILWNISLGKKECLKCFSKNTLKKLKAHRGILRRILDKSESLKKRRKIFLESGKEFRRVIENFVLTEFFTNCLE